MFSIIANPTDTKPVNFGKLNLQNIIVCKNTSAAGRTAVASSGAVYADGAIFTVGSTAINSVLYVPLDPTFFDNGTSFGAITYIGSYNNATGQMRMMVPFPCADGQTVQGFFWRTFDLMLAGTGVVGTATIALKKMELSSGVLTTIATMDEDISASISATSRFVTGASPVALTSGDILLMDISVAPKSGTHNTSNYVYLRFQLATSVNVLTIF